MAGRHRCCVAKGKDICAVRSRNAAYLGGVSTEAQAHGLESSNGGLITFAGGIPLRTAAGEILGAIGVSGGQVRGFTIWIPIII